MIQNLLLMNKNVRSDVATVLHYRFENTCLTVTLAQSIKDAYYFIQRKYNREL